MWFKVKKTILYVAITALAIICLLPFVMMMLNATRTSNEIISGFSFIPGKALVDNWNTMIKYFDVFRGLWNSLFLAIITTLVSSYFSALTAYGFAVYNFKGKNIIFTILLVLMMVPAQLGLLGFYELVTNLGMIDSYLPLVIPAAANTFIVFFLKQYLETVLPMSIVEAARIDGANEMSIFHKLGIPIMMPGIATMAIGTFIGSWNNYLVPLVVLITQKKFTLPLMLGTLRATPDLTKNLGASYMGIAVSVVPIIIAFMFFSKYIISSISAGAVKE